MKSGDLFQNHTRAWSSLWRSGVEVELPPPTHNISSLIGLHSLAQRINSSIYYLLSQQRDDWSLGTASPGGLATNGYDGNAFWDSEMWITWPLVQLWPSIGRAQAA